MIKMIRPTLAAFVLYTFLIKHSSSALFDYGSYHGDQVIIDSYGGYNSLDYGNTDDGVKLINIPKTPYFHKAANTKLQLSTNGYVVFGDTEIVNAAKPSDFPVNYNGRLVPMVAAFWTDFYFSKHAAFYYQIHTSGKILKDFENLIKIKYPEETFQPTHAIKVTWDHVLHKYKSHYDFFTFQMVIASNGKSTFVLFLYDSLPYYTKASVGFQENLHMYRYEYSMDLQVGHKLLQSSDVGVNGVRAYRIAEEVLDCSTKPDGLYDHPSDCEKYIVCSLGHVAEIRKCNNSEHFNPQYKYCVPPEQYPCNQEKIQDCTTIRNGYTFHLTDCRKFVHCLNGKVNEVKSCNYGTVFNPSLGVCVHEGQYTCSDKNGPTNQQFCDGKKDGDFPDPKSCNHFIKCANGLMHTMPCPAGLQFNPQTKYCDWAFNVNCHV